MNTPNHRTITLGAVLVALLVAVAMLTVFVSLRQAIATEPTDPDYCQYHPEDPICTGEPTEPTDTEPTASVPPEETTVVPPEETTVISSPPPEETTMPTVPEPTDPTASAPPETTMLPPEDTDVDIPPDTDGPNNPDKPVDKPNGPDTPGDNVVVINAPEGPAPITVTVTETTLICETPERVFEVPRADLDDDGTISNVEDRAMVVAGETGSEDAVLQNTAATRDQADAAVKSASLPETGGIPLLPLGAVVVGAALIAFRLVRSK